MKSVWVKRQKNEYDFPYHFIPEYCDKTVCDRHGYKYDPDDDNLIRKSENIILFNKLDRQTKTTTVHIIQR